jgi:hypothetical protein
MTRGGKPSGEIVFRKTTLDLSTFWKRKSELSLAVKPSVSDVAFQMQHIPSSPLPPVYEMPSRDSSAALGADEPIIMPDLYFHPGKPARKSISRVGQSTGLKFWRNKEERPQPPSNSDEDEEAAAGLSALPALDNHWRNTLDEPQPRLLSCNERGAEYKDHESVPLSGTSTEHAPHTAEERRFSSNMC